MKPVIQTNLAFDQRQVDLITENLEEISAALTFMASRAGSYHIDEDGVIRFQTSEDTDQYNAHLSKLAALSTRQENLNKEMLEEFEKAKSRLFSRTE